MSGAVVLLVLVFAVAIPLALWVAIENETSNPTVVDRTEAERIAKESGGRREARSNADPSPSSDPGPDSRGVERDHAIADRVHTDDADADTERRWSNDHATRSRDPDRTDRTRDDPKTESDGRTRGDRNRDDHRR